MKKPAYKFIKRLIDRITSVNQSNKDCFTYFGHYVSLQSGTRDYVSVTICRNCDMYSGSIAEFSFDFWTKQLHVEYADNDSIEEAIIKAFKSLYHSITLTRENYEN